MDCETQHMTSSNFLHLGLSGSPFIKVDLHASYFAFMSKTTDCGDSIKLLGLDYLYAGVSQSKDHHLK